MCLAKDPTGTMVETGDFCLVPPLCSLKWWRTAWGGFSGLNGIMCGHINADGMMCGHMVVHV